MNIIRKVEKGQHHDLNILIIYLKYTVLVFKVTMKAFVNSCIEACIGKRFLANKDLQLTIFTPFQIDS